MQNHRYQLYPKEAGIKAQGKTICPRCGQKTFVCYTDTHTGQALSDEVGKCDREVKCGLHITPKMFFENGGTAPQTGTVKPLPKLERVFLPLSALKQYSYAITHSSLFRGLERKISGLDLISAFEKYQVRTGSEGQTIFPQFDRVKNLCYAKVVFYDQMTAKRTKNIFKVKHEIKENEYLSQCLFGLHLIDDSDNIVCVVESEKTALIASIFFPSFIWVATGGCNNLKLIQDLKGKRVKLYPDADKVEEWKQQAEPFKHLFQSLTVCDLRSQMTETEIRNGFDIADLILKNITQ